MNPISQNLFHASAVAGASLPEGFISLVGKTIENWAGGAFDPSYPITEINDGIAETTNAASIGFVPYPDYMKVKVDLGANYNIRGIAWAPQGIKDTTPYNTPLQLSIYTSTDGVNFGSPFFTEYTISTGILNWNPGTYRVFVKPSNQYVLGRYVGIVADNLGSNNSGVSLSELCVVQLT